MNLYKSYGKVIVPKGTLLYRHEYPDDNKSYKFFALHQWGANAFISDGSILTEWEVVTEIVLLFMIKKITHLSNPISAIGEIYNTYFPHELQQENDLQIKENQKILKKIIDKFTSKDIFGWLSSLEDGGSELECLLFEENLNKVRLTNTGKNITTHPRNNALMKMTIQPSKEVIDACKDEFNLKMYPFTRYKKWITACIKDESKRTGIPIKQAAESFYSLRTALAI